MSAMMRKMRRQTMQDTQIVELYEKSESCRIVAEQLGVSDETVRRALIRSDIKRTHRHPKPPSDKTPCGKKYCWASVTMLKRFTSMPFSEIVDFTGIPSASVGNIISTRCRDLMRDYSRIDKDEIECEYLAGATTYELGEKYDVDHATISKWMRKRGIHRGKGGYREWHEHRVCERCGAGYVANSTSAKYCAECRAVLNAPKPRKPRKVRPSKQIESYMNICAECGSVFMTFYPDKKCCSNECHKKREDSQRRKARKRRRAAKKGAQNAEGIHWRDLIERDHGICQICGLPVDVNDHRWGTSGPLYPSQDHIVPLAKGGQDTLENSQLAHIICNSIKTDCDETTEVIRRAKEQAITYLQPRVG